MLLTFAQFGVSRLNRILPVLLGTAVYTFACIGLANDGYLEISTAVLAPLFGGWLLGLVGLVFAGDLEGRIDARMLTFSKVLWCNLGVVVTAALVPHQLRLLLLMLPLFGVVYAGLHLTRNQLFSVGLCTWLAYLASAGVLLVVRSADLLFEGLLALAFTCMLGGMLAMATEVTALRGAFEQRRARLDDAMDKLSDLAMRDELTGLYNRRFIMEVLDRQKALADRGQLSFTLLYCDLDHFKTINDRYGHQFGDQVLVEFAGLAESVVRSVDYVARLGGEEFLLVLVGADDRTAENVATRLCESARSLRVESGDPDFRLTVSVGVATFRWQEQVEDVIQRADRALYRAKSQGRDQIVLAA